MTTQVCAEAELLTTEIWGAGGGGKMGVGRRGGHGFQEEEE